MSNSRGIHFAQFFHRLNLGATFESICGLCYQTVAKAAHKEGLRPDEAAHSCSRSNVIPFVYRRVRSL